MKLLKRYSAKRTADMTPLMAAPILRVLLMILAGLFLSVSVIAGPATQSLAQSPASGMGTDDSSTYGDAQDKAAEERRNASPEERENAERMSPNDEGPISESQDDRQDQMENATPEEEANADRADPNRDEPGTQEEAQNSATEQAKNATPEEQANAESVDGDREGSGMLDGLALKFFNVIGTHIWDWSIGWLGQKIAQDIGDALLFLPDPSADEEVKGVYNDVKKVMQGLLAVGIALMSLAMIVRSANTGLNFSGLKMLPRILAVALILGALPSLFGVLSTLGTDLTAALMPNDEQIDQAKLEMTKAVAANLVITNFLNLILAVVGVYVLLMLIIVALLKSIVFVLLFIAAPFPLIASLIPGFEKYASIWAKAVLVTAFIPAIWATELWLGAILIQMPQALFGEMVNTLGFLSNGAFTTIIAIGMFYLIYKTPFIAFSWAIPSYEPSFGGSIWSFGKFAGKTAMAAGIKSAVGGAVGGFMGGAAASKGAQSDVPKGERPPSDRLGGLAKQNYRRSEVKATDDEGNVKNQLREEWTEDVSRNRNMEHDETMSYFGPKDTNGPGGSPPPPKTQTVGSGGRGGRLNRGDRSYRDEQSNEGRGRSRDDHKIVDLDGSREE